MKTIFQKYNQIIIGLIFLFYFSYTINNSLYINGYVVQAVLLTFIIYFQTIFTFLFFYNKNGRPRIQDWMRVMLFLLLVLDFMKLVNNSNGKSLISFSTTTISLDDSSFVLLIISLAFLSLDLSWIIFNKLKRIEIINEEFRINHKDWVFFILIVSTLFQSYLLYIGVIGFGNKQGGSGILSLIKMLSEYLNPFALVISAYIIFIQNTTKYSHKIIFYCAISIQIFTGLLTGMKENALEPILYVIIVFLIAGKKLPKTFIYAGLFVLAILYPINNAYREVINNPFLNKGSNIVNISIAIKKVMNEPLSKTFVGGVEKYGDRSSMFPYLIYVTNLDERWTYYKNMTRYVALPINWIIPRVIWENKPRADIGAVLYILITNNKISNTSVTPTNIGWAYLEGNIFYVFLIFIILGLIFEYIDSKNHKKPIVLLFYIILFHKAIKPEWDPYFMISSLIPMFILYWSLLKIIGQTRIRNEN
jgi:hypothetical protein